MARVLTADEDLLAHCAAPRPDAPPGRPTATPRLPESEAKAIVLWRAHRLRRHYCRATMLTEGVWRGTVGQRTSVVRQNFSGTSPPA